MILKAPVASHSDAKLMPEICFFSRGFLGENRKYRNTAIKRVVQYTDNEIAISDKLCTRHKVSPDTRYEQNPSQTVLFRVLRCGGRP